MAKRKSKKSKASMVETPSMPEEREQRSVTVRKIDNGYLAEHSSSGGEGGYTSKTVYHPKKPTIMMDMAGEKQARKFVADSRGDKQNKKPAAKSSRTGSSKSRMKALEGKLI